MSHIKNYRFTDLLHYHCHAVDGELGKVEDILYDPHTRKVRYLLLRTGSWHFGHDILVDPASIVALDGLTNLIEVNCPRSHYRNSPEIDRALPFSRHYEEQYQAHFAQASRRANLDTQEPDQLLTETPASVSEFTHDYPQLTRCEHILGLKLSDNEVCFAQVADLILEEPAWQISNLEVELKNTGTSGTEGRRHWIPANKVINVNLSDRKISMDVTRQQLSEDSAKLAT
ncbi:MAG: hypothetical protein HKN43_02015 [Rhodothermales bacterium]|nr:hypothetical protein [Rhodothermales bacterium]